MFISFPSINSRTPATFSMKLLSMLISSFMFNVFTHWIVLRLGNVTVKIGANKVNAEEEKAI